MDDVTEVSSTQSIERQNTITVTRNIEMRSKTLFSIIGGFIIGLLLFFMLFKLVGMTIGALIVVACSVGTPLLLVGRVNDPTQQVRWRRLVAKIKSRDIEGQVFFPNSDTPENITRIETVVMKR